MCGRAGRPPFDDTGTVIIMTRRETVHLYENLLNGCEMVESQLLPCAMEHLNAEIIQLTVSDISLAIEWLKCSYLYVRIKKNPENYGIKRGIPCELLEKHMREICVKKISELAEYGMIWTDEDGFILKPLEPGRSMTKFYMKFDTMKQIVKAPEGCSLEDALRIVCHSEEISWIQLRRNEKKLLNDINIDKDGRLRFHVLGEKGKRKKRIQTREEKIFVLVNDCLTGDPSAHDLSLNQDMNSICTNGCRISKCMKECFIYRKSYKGTLNSTLLAKSLHQRLWDDSPYLLKQLPGIGMVTAKALNSARISSFESMEEADPRKIEIITGRKFPFGNHIKESLKSLPPKLVMKIEEVDCKKFGNTKMTITITRLSKSANSDKQHYADILVGSEEDNKILFHEKLRAGEFCSPYSATVLVSCPQYGKVTVKADLIFEEYVGLDVHEKLVITWEDKFVMTRVRQSKMAASDYSVPKEFFLIEDDQNTSSAATPAKSPKLRNAEKNTHDSLLTFDLLEEETEEDMFSSDHVVNDVKITGELQKAEDKPMNKGTIFDHIRKKAKTFPTLMTSRSMDISHEPMILTKKIDSVSQFQADKSPGDSIIMIDSEPMEASVSMLIDITESPVPVKAEPRQTSKSIECNNEYQGVGCKRVTTLEAYAPLEQATFDAQQNSECNKPSQPRNHLDVSYLGFRSVFSFL